MSETWSNLVARTIALQVTNHTGPNLGLWGTQSLVLLAKAIAQSQWQQEMVRWTRYKCWVKWMKPIKSSCVASTHFTPSFLRQPHFKMVPSVLTNSEFHNLCVNFSARTLWTFLAEQFFVKGEYPHFLNAKLLSINLCVLQPCDNPKCPSHR